jgi:abortive infection bacteriophage resistance protein
MRDFHKQYTSPLELVKLLKRRCLSIEDENKVEGYIRNIGYFRLSAYFYPFLKEPKEEHLFKDNSSFKKVMLIYRFDRKLRLLMFNEIEKIEVAIRSTIVNITAQETNDPFWMTNDEKFIDLEKFEHTRTLIDKEYNRSKEDFIKHFKETYSNNYPPVWELSEILPLGILTRIYDNIKSCNIQKKISRRFYLPIPVFQSWMTIITLTRNSCCHHARVWNRIYTLRPLIMRNMTRPWVSDTIDKQRIFYNLCIIKYFADIISPNNHIKKSLNDLFEEFPIIDKTAMGFPANWESEPLWHNINDTIKQPQ